METMVERDKRFFLDSVKVVLKHEGGYVNDLDDPGGETKYGISKKQYPNINIKELTEDEAIEIYYKDYWSRNRCDELPLDIRSIYFDICVNIGGRGACRILQRAVNQKGGDLDVDGRIGPKTLHQVFKYKLGQGRLKAYRVKYYVDLINKKPALEKYFYGWFKRSIS